MAGSNGFQGRYKLSDVICNKINNLFIPNSVEVIPFGMENLTSGNRALINYICSIQANLSKSAMLIKFAPDYILLRKTDPQEIYFLEVKVSKTPLYYEPRLNQIRAQHPHKTILVSDVGDIAREAWNAYRNLFPNTVIIAGCSYNPKVLMAQFADKIDCLYCHTNTGITCTTCPVNSGNLFPPERNLNAAGSQTPHTNIDYSTFEIAEDFFAKLNMPLDKTVAGSIRQEIRNLGITKSGFPSEDEQLKIRQQLISEGCTWL